MLDICGDPPAAGPAEDRKSLDYKNHHQGRGCRFRRKIPPMIGTPRSTGDNLPCNWVGDIVEGSPEYTIISDKPVFIRILSDGYTQQWLEIKKDSPYRNVVRLSKK